MALELPQLLEGPAEMGRRLEAAEPAHRVVALLDPTVVLLHPIIQLLVAAVLHRCNQRLTNGPWIGRLPIGGDPCGSHAPRTPRLGHAS